MNRNDEDVEKEGRKKDGIRERNGRSIGGLNDDEENMRERIFRRKKKIEMKE